MDCEEIRLNLLAYLDGEVSERERAAIEEHLADCADCAAHLERLQALQADLWDAVPLGLEQLRLPDAAAERIRANLRRVRERQSWMERLGDLVRPRQPLARQPLALVKAAIPLLVALCFLVAGLLGRRPAPVQALETLVLAPETLAAGTDAALRVIVRKGTSTTPISDAEVRVYLRPQGQQATLLYSGRTGDGGTADVTFRVPNYEPDRLAADLVISAASPLGESEVRQKVEVRRSFRLLLTSDKPLYRPGQPIHLRALALDAIHRLPVKDRPTVFDVYGPGGELLFEQDVPTSAYGIAATDYVLPADAPLGAYRLSTQLGDTRSEREVMVGRYERPRFKVTLDVSRPYYLAGEVVEAKVTAHTFDKEPLRGVDATVRAYLHAPGRTLLATLSGRTDRSGAYLFRITLPAQFPGEDTSLALEAAVADLQGRREWAGRVVPLAMEPLAIDAVAEDGRLRPGLENLVYVLATRPDGAPTRAQLDINVLGEDYAFQTDEYGLAMFSLRPGPDVREVPVRITATDAEGRTVRRTLLLSTDQGPAQVLLRLDRATYQVGDFIHAEVLAGQKGVVYLDVVHRGAGQTLSTHVLPLHNGRATLALDVSPQMAGTLELHAYQVLSDGTLARDARLAVVSAPTEVAVEVRSDKASYLPGDVARVSVGTSVGGAPTQSALGIAVVDESVFALEERAPGFAKLFFLLDARLLDAGEQLPGVALAELLDPTAVDAARAAQDQAARAAWARLPVRDLPLLRSTPSEQSAAVEARSKARLRWLGWCLSVVLLILPLGQWSAVIAQLRSAGWGATASRRAALRRSALLIAGLTVVVLAPLTVLATLASTLVLGDASSKALLVVLLSSWLAILVALGIRAWRRRKDWTQIAVLVTVAHGLLGALLFNVAERGGDPGPGLIWAVTLVFVAALLSWLLVAAASWVERQRGTASLTVTLVLLSVAIVVLLGALDLATSPLAEAIGDPQVYVGPAGWLIGCAPKAVMVEKETAIQETVIVEREVEKVVKETVIVEVEKQVTKVIEKQASKIVVGTPVVEEPAIATATQAAQATPTASAVEPESPAATSPPPTSGAKTPTAAAPDRPLEAPPPLLGQYAPETIYWAPEAITDESGRLAFDIPLPDTPAAWRLTVLASTLQGQLGSTETTLTASQ